MDANILGLRPGLPQDRLNATCYWPSAAVSPDLLHGRSSPAIRPAMLHPTGTQQGDDLRPSREATRDKCLCKDFKTALEKMTREEIRVHIQANRAPQGEHQGCLNDPSTDEVAILIVGDEYGKRDIMLQNRDSARTQIKISINP